MLVYAKDGIAHVGTYRVYGRLSGQAPTDIPFEIYEAYKDMLLDATYREIYLTKLFNRPFPEVAFAYGELRYLPEEQLNKILEAMGIEYSSDWSAKRKVENIKSELRRVSPQI